MSSLQLTKPRLSTFSLFFIVREVIEGGYTMEQAKAQFKGSFHPDDWRAVMEEAQQANKG